MRFKKFNKMPSISRDRPRAPPAAEDIVHLKKIAQDSSATLESESGSGSTTTGAPFKSFSASSSRPRAQVSGEDVAHLVRIAQS